MFKRYIVGEFNKFFFFFSSTRLKLHDDTKVFRHNHIAMYFIFLQYLLCNNGYMLFIIKFPSKA